MDIRIFLAHAVKFELETEEAYLKLVDLMTAKSNLDVAVFFREMAGFSRLHRDTAMRRAGFDASTDIHSIIASWSGSDTETPCLKDFEIPLDLDGAMSLALAAERRGVTFYEEVARTATDTQTRRHAFSLRNSPLKNVGMCWHSNVSLDSNRTNSGRKCSLQELLRQPLRRNLFAPQNRHDA